MFNLMIIQAVNLPLGVIVACAMRLGEMMGTTRWG